MTDDGSKKKKKKNAEPRRAIALGDTALGTLTAAEAQSSVQICKGFKSTVNGLVVVGQPDLAEAEVAGNTLRVFEKSSQFAIGDFANYVEEKFGEAASQIIDAESGWNLKTVQVYSWLAKKIHPSRRRMDRLTIRHHMLVAVLTAKQQEYWLTKAANDDGDDPWTVKELRDAIEAGGETLPIGWWVIVEAKNESDQSELMKRLEGEGRSVKASTRRRKKDKADKKDE